MSESHLVVYVFVLIAPQSMFFKTVVSVHYDTEEYVPHIIFVCQILMLISTFILSSDNTVVLEHFNFIYI